MQHMKKMIEYESAAKKVGVSSRTIMRWKKLGCKIHDPKSLCEFIATYHCPHIKSGAIKNAPNLILQDSDNPDLFDKYGESANVSEMVRMRVQLYHSMIEAKSIKHELKTGKKPKPKLRPFLYLLKNRRNGYYKIGISIDPEIREKTLQSEDPDIFAVKVWQDKGDHEKFWHRHFKDQRIRGEWFWLTDAQVRFMVYKMTNYET